MIVTQHVVFAVIAVLSIIAPVWQSLCLCQLLWPLSHLASLQWDARIKHECPPRSEEPVCFRQEGLALSLHHSERSQLSVIPRQKYIFCQAAVTHVTLEHKNSLKCPFLDIEIHASSES